MKRTRIHEFVNGVEGKICPHCGEWHPLSDYGVNNMAADKLQSWCKGCVSDYGKERTKAMKEKEKATTTLEEQEKSTIEMVSDISSGMVGQIKLLEDEMLNILMENEFLEQKAEGAVAEKDEVETELKSTKAEVERLQREIANMRRDERNLDYLSEDEIARVLNSRNCSVRLLARALYEKEANVQIAFVAPITGETQVIRREVVLS